MSVGTTGARDRCDVEVPGQAAEGPAGPSGGPRRVRSPRGRGRRGPTDARGPVRPAGRRGPAVLPPARPRVAGGGATPARSARAVEAPVARRCCDAGGSSPSRSSASCWGCCSACSSGSWCRSPGPLRPPRAGTTVTVVGAGESLSDVAGRVAPGSDADAVAGRIRAQQLDGVRPHARASPRRAGRCGRGVRPVAAGARAPGDLRRRATSPSGGRGRPRDQAVLAVVVGLSDGRQRGLIARRPDTSGRGAPHHPLGHRPSRLRPPVRTRRPLGARGPGAVRGVAMARSARRYRPTQHLVVTLV